MDVSGTGAVLHLVAELSGIAPALLHDAALLGGLLIAAAGAAGAHTASPPELRTIATRGVDVLLPLEGGHATLHAIADRGILLLDVVGPAPLELKRALEVFKRRLLPTRVRAEQIERVAALART